MRCTAECQDVSHWKVCCGQAQSLQDICQACRCGITDAERQISSVRTQQNVLQFKGVLNAVFTFPFAQYYSFEPSVFCYLKHMFKNEES